MNKNLKKVISAVAALAMSVTSFVAMASYPDVADTDKHASAINELSALGVIEGFEDGTFHPDELVTRAQMAAMVCRALNNFNAESNKIQKFNDVPADNWAAGWVATAADAGIINGTGNGNFDPSLNVTYAQTAKMLVSAMGYGDWAENAGGWPSGYLSYANSTGVTSNVTGVANDTALTRAQCAQMIVNALEAPILKQTSMQTGYDGKPYAVLTQMDGTNTDKSPYTSLLVDKWDVYVVNGSVTKTNKSDSSVSADEATYEVTQSKNYMGNSYASSLLPSAGKDSTGAWNTASVSVKIGNLNADAYLNVYTKALIKNDDYNDAELVYIEGSNKNVEVKFETSLIDAADYYDDTNSNYDVLKVKKNASTTTKTSYKLNKNWKLIVNGAEISATKANLDAYVTYAGNPDVTVTLTDYPTSGAASTDGYYDVISVDKKLIAVVDEVVDDDDVTTIYFKASSGTNGESSIEVKKNDDEYSYKFTKDGAAINPTELKEYDVLSITYSLANGDSFENSSFYDVVVSQKTVEGKVTQRGDDDLTNTKFFTVNNENYSIASNNLVNESKIRTGDEYTFYLTAEGKIAAIEKLASSINYAIIDRAYEANSGEMMVRIIAKDGKKYEYELASNGDTDGGDGKGSGLVAQTVTAGSVTPWKGTNSYNELTLGGLSLKDRVIDYSLTSGNKIKLKKPADTDMKAEDSKGDKEYKASTKRLGNTKVDESTVILDLTDWAKNKSNAVGVLSVDSLVDGQDYGFVSATNSTSNNTAAFVAIYSGVGGWSNDTQMAVVSKVLSTSVDGVTRDVLSAYHNGELTELVCADESVVDETKIKEGTAIVFSKDTDGYVDTVLAVMPNVDIDANTKFDFYKAMMAADGGINTAEPFASELKGPDGKVTFIFAPVISKSATDVEIPVDGSYKSTIKKDAAYGGTEVAYYVSVNDTDTISYANDVKVYSFKGSNSKGYKVSKGAAASVIASAVPTAGYLDTSSMYINLGKASDVAGGKKSPNTITFALMRVYDDEVQEIYTIQTSDANGREASNF